LKLRYYQRDAIDSLHKWFNTRPAEDHALIALPTAAGKTIIFSHFIKEIFAKDPTARFLVLAHRKELVEQAETKLKTVWPEAPVGVLAAGMKRFEIDSQILIASRDTLASPKRLEAVGSFDYMIIDEAHNVPPSSHTRYKKIITTLSDRKPMRVMGCTATPYRMGQGYIYGNRKDHFFKGLAYSVSIPELIRNGFLSRLSAYAVNDNAVIDAGAVALKFKNGDFKESELEKVAMVDDTILQVINDWIDNAYTKGRTATVFFCVSVLHAEKMTQCLKNYGIMAECVTGETPKEKREDILERFNNGLVHAICNVGVLTEGWDAPRADCVALLRPTQSVGLFVQMCGRGMRLHDDKENCLLLDYGENVARHGCLDEVQPDRTAPGRYHPKICASCNAINIPSARKCVECGQEFEGSKKFQELQTKKEKEVAKRTKAEKQAVLSDERKKAKPRYKPVTDIYATVTKSMNGSEYCQVIFTVKDEFFPKKMPLMFGHPKAHHMAVRRWKKIAEKWGAPKQPWMAAELINSGAFENISEIVLQKQGKYENVIGIKTKQNKEIML
jgi:DNA repair protein RadD|tara:strand:+ start:1199 stop:2869 length:1671 start_codon:yes stop_codon:yes gene_type:complete